MKFLITGASGFIGRNLILATPKDWKVIATYCNDDSFPNFIREKNLSHVKALRIDLSNPTEVRSVDSINKHYDACVHLAANGDPAYSTEAPAHDLAANTMALLNVVSEWTFDKFIYFSSGAVYDGLKGEVNPDSFVRPLLPYAISKWASECYVMNAQKNGRIKSAKVIRFFGAYGPYEPSRKIYGRLIKQFGINKNPRLQIKGNGKNFIDAMYVEDLMRAIFLLLANNAPCKLIDLCSGSRMTVEKLVRDVASHFGLDAQIEFVGKVPEFIEFTSNDLTIYNEFGFSPKITLDEGISKHFDWIMREHNFD
jgi:nucleoside-diphosphate-sugar epimerase